MSLYITNGLQDVLAAAEQKNVRAQSHVESSLISVPDVSGCYRQPESTNAFPLTIEPDEAAESDITKMLRR